MILTFHASSKCGVTARAKGRFKILKAITVPSTQGKDKEMLLDTYKAICRLVYYATLVWVPSLSDTKFRYEGDTGYVIRG